MGESSGHDHFLDRLLLVEPESSEIQARPQGRGSKGRMAGSSAERHGDWETWRLRHARFTAEDIAKHIHVTSAARKWVIRVVMPLATLRN